MWEWLKNVLFDPERNENEEDLEYNEDYVLFWIRIFVIILGVILLVAAAGYVGS